MARTGAGAAGRSLRTPILLLILLAIGPVLVGRFWQITQEARRAVVTAQDQARALATLAATEHEEVIAKTRTLLEVLVRVPVVRQALVDQCHMLLRDLARTAPWQRRLWVVRPDGMAACGSHSARVDLNIADREYFRRALATRRFVVSDYVMTRVQQQPAIIAAMPALDEDGNVEAVALVTLNVGTTRVPLEAPDGSDVAMLMVDSSNTVVAEAGLDGAGAVVGSVLPAGSLAGLLARDGARGEAEGPDGVTRLWGVARLEQPAGAFAVGLRKAEVVAHAQASALRSVTILLAVGGLAALAAWLGAERLLLRNIRTLARAASEIGSGNLRLRPQLPASAGEFNIVGEALGEMAGQLEARDRELQASKAVLADKTATLEATLEHMDQGLVVVDEDARVRVCNRRATELLGLPAPLLPSGVETGSVDGARVLLDEGFRPVHQVYEHVGPTGAVLEIRTTPLPSGGAVRTYTDVTERKSAELRILHTARHDPLTELPNRLLFRERLHDALAASQRSNGPFAVLWVDLDRFKAVNDALGHAVGDGLLVSVAERIRSVLRQGDVVARLGGDEFAILQLASEQPLAASRLAERLIAELSRPFEVQEHDLHVGASVGVAVWPSDGTDADGLLKNADLALYRAKADGRGVFRFFEPGMDAQVKARRTLELELRNALAAEEFVLHYQPLADARERRIVAFEALVRWQHPTRGLLAPDTFIHIAEETRLILPLGEWVLREACRQAARWPGEVAVAVNVSAAQFASAGLVRSVREALDASGLRPGRLQLEITESVLMGDPELAVRSFRELRELGVRIALDDFGTGYSSLSYLRLFPFDKMKIDRSFVRELTTNADSLAFIRTIVSLGSSLGLRVCVEGVETEEQYEIVRALGCAEVQGYLIGRPQPAADALRLSAKEPRAA